MDCGVGAVEGRSYYWGRRADRGRSDATVGFCCRARPSSRREGAAGSTSGSDHDGVEDGVGGGVDEGAGEGAGEGVGKGVDDAIDDAIDDAMDEVSKKPGRCRYVPGTKEAVDERAR